MTPQRVQILRDIVDQLDSRLLEGMCEVRRMREMLVPCEASDNLGRKEPIYEREIVSVLRENGRLTLKPLLEALAARGRKCHEATIKRYLKALTISGRIDNRHDVNPPGYGLIASPAASVAS